MSSSVNEELTRLESVATKDDRESGKQGTMNFLMDFRLHVTLLLRSVGVGIMAAIALAALAFAAASFFNIDTVGVYVVPARVVLPVLGRIVPSGSVYGLVPSGGAAAGVLLILVSAVVPWTLFFGAIYFAWAASKHRRATAASTGTSPH